MQANVIAQHIEMRPSEMHGQKPCIAGSRIRVKNIHIWHVAQGKSPEQIVS